MKKMLLVFLLLALAVFALSACGCQHEWTEASCTAAKTCAKCGETEGAALGHDFSAATCTTAEICARCGETGGESLGHEYGAASCAEPETCSRCGDTQGEALGHTFGQWKPETESDTMTRQCTVCEEAETEPLDHARILEESLLGFWDYYYLQMSDGTQLDAYHLNWDSLGMYLNFKEGSLVDFYMDGEGSPREITWKFDNYQKVDGDHLYYFNLVVLDTGSEETDVLLKALYITNASRKSSSLLVAISQTQSVVLDRNRALTKNVTGTWVNSENGQMKTITFASDRTFTADFGQEIHGTWHLRPVYITGGERYCYITLCFSVDGSNQIIRATLPLGSQEIPLDEYWNDYDPTISLCTVDGTYVSLSKKTEEEVALLEAAVAAGKLIPVGSWTSSYVRAYTDDISHDTVTEDYSILFAEDGTFTAVLDQEYSGTWDFQRVDLLGSSVIYEYFLNFDGVADTVSVYANFEEELAVHFYVNQTCTSIYFQQMTEEKIAQREAEAQAALQQIVGDWNSLYIIEFQEEDNLYRTVSDYSFSFAEDGTLTAVLDTERTGTWKYRSTYYNKIGDTVCIDYYYVLRLDGVEGSWEVSIDTYGDRQLRWYTQTQNRYKTLYFSRLTPDLLEQFQKAPTGIVGTWTAEADDIRSDNPDLETSFIDCAYTLTVREDGTYTAEYDKTLSGTWACGYGKDGFYYVFGAGIYAHYYSPDDNGGLQFWYNLDNGSYIRVTMKKD